MDGIGGLTHEATWLAPVLWMIALAALGWCLWWLVFFVLRRLATGPLKDIDAAITTHLRAPTELMLPLCGVLIADLVDEREIPFHGALAHAIVLALIALFAWLLIRVINAVGEVLAIRYPVNASDDGRARRIETQFKVLHHIGSIVIGVLAVGAMLVTFPQVRALGATLFASAGAAGLILGLAARPTLSNLFAGVQIALAQPIRLEDSVVVQGQAGWIEEINATFVVVRMLDLRRLVLPLSWFIENPFANWSRAREPSLPGSVLLWTDYLAPIQTLRERLGAVLQADPLWDRGAWSLVVSDASVQAIQLCANLSARNAGDLYQLQCNVREALILFLQANPPASLPHTRVELEPAAAPPPVARASPATGA